MVRVVGSVILMALVLTGCCHTCGERPAAPAPGPGLAEVPAPYRLVYDSWPTRYIPEVVVIQGGRQFVLQPDIPGEVTWK